MAQPAAAPNDANLLFENCYWARSYFLFYMIFVLDTLWIKDLIIMDIFKRTLQCCQIGSCCVIPYPNWYVDNSMCHHQSPPKIMIKTLVLIDFFLSFQYLRYRQSICSRTPQRRQIRSRWWACPFSNLARAHRPPPPARRLHRSPLINPITTD